MIRYITSDPGGFNVIYPLIQKSIENKDNFKIYATGIAKLKFEQYNIDYTNCDFISNFNEYFNKEFNYGDIIVASTSATILFEKKAIEIANKKSLISYVILDQWLNYEMRFLDITVDNIVELDKEKKKGYKYLPTFILTMDDISKKDLIKIGIPKNKIKVVGSIHLNNFVNNFIKLDIKNNKETILYVTEPIRTTYGDSSYFGYDEISILESILKVCKKDYNIIIRKHPKDQTNYSKYNLEISDKDINYDLSRADIVIGMSSMFLIEALSIGKKVISLQIGLKIENPFIFSRLGIIKTILSEEELKKELKNVNFCILDEKLYKNAINKAYAEIKMVGE